MAAAAKGKASQNLGDSAAMKKMLEIAARLYGDSPQLYEPAKAQSFLLSAASNPETGLHLPPLPGLTPHPNSTTKHAEKTPSAIQQELETLQKDYEKELQSRDSLNSEKQEKLKSYIRKEQDYRERIEEYSRCIKYYLANTDQATTTPNTKFFFRPSKMSTERS